MTFVECLAKAKRMGIAMYTSLLYHRHLRLVKMVMTGADGGPQDKFIKVVKSPLARGHRFGCRKLRKSNRGKFKCKNAPSLVHLRPPR